MTDERRDAIRRMTASIIRARSDQVMRETEALLESLCRELVTITGDPEEEVTALVCLAAVEAAKAEGG